MSSAKERKQAKKEELYRRMILNAPYGEEVTWVIGHRSPDSDAVGSAIAYAYLLNALGIKARAAISGKINNETRYAFEKHDIEIPPVLEEAEGRQFVLVDHSSYSQAIRGMKKARILGILDHHGMGDITLNDPIYVRSASVGATATLVWLAFQETGIAIPQKIARVLLISLLSDTRNMLRNVSDADRAAFEDLTVLAEIGDTDALYKKMENALADYGDMSDKEIFLSDYKEYEAGGVRYGIGVIRACSEENILCNAASMAEVMKEFYRESGQDMLFAIYHNRGVKDGGSNIVALTCGEGASALLEKAFPCRKEGGCYLIRENLSRKTDIVPAFTRLLQ